MISVGENIKRIREAKKLSQSDLAERLNVTRQAVSNWELGKTEPDIDTLHRIADTLGVSIEELIYGFERKPKVIQQVVRSETVKSASSTGLTFGAALAMVISYVEWHSIGWAILHGCFSWGYVIYYLIRYASAKG